LPRHDVNGQRRRLPGPNALRRFQGGTHFACLALNAGMSASCTVAESVVIRFAAERFSHATISGGRVTSSRGLVRLIPILTFLQVV
jgi:hypothetical protein